MKNIIKYASASLLAGASVLLPVLSLAKVATPLPGTANHPKYSVTAKGDDSERERVSTSTSENEHVSTSTPERSSRLGSDQLENEINDSQDD
ncbi:MAG: hypothetical protein WC526_03240 [Patescibacteria group bacterium]